MHSQHNPHPDIKYIETRPSGQTWYQCQKCSRYMHSLKYFGWECPFCNDEEIDMIIGALDY